MTEIILIGIFSAFLTVFINYCIGKPGSKDFSPYEIFSGYTVWLSIRRLKNVGLYKQYWQQYIDSYNRTKDLHEVLALKNDMKKIYYEAAEPYFTWERAAGMCPVCFGVWMSVITSIFFAKNFIHLLIIIVISHVIIRIINKIL